MQRLVRSRVATRKRVEKKEGVDDKPHIWLARGEVLDLFEESQEPYQARAAVVRRQKKDRDYPGVAAASIVRRPGKHVQHPNIFELAYAWIIDRSSKTDDIGQSDRGII